MRYSPRSIFNNVVFLLLATIIAMVTIEFGYRIYIGHKPAKFGAFTSYIEVAKAQGWTLEEAKNHIADNATHNRLTYWEYYLYSTAPRKSKDAEFTSYFSARATPDSLPIKSARNIIWMFGGSTMQNLETTDRLTIANTVAKTLNPAAGVAVLNFGVGSFHSTLELIKFHDLLRRVKRSEHPKVAVFYDGFNDASHSFNFGPGNLQSDLSNKLAALVEGDYQTLLIYSGSQLMSRYSKVWEKYISPRIQAALFSKLRGEKGDVNHAVAVYLMNQKMIEATCDQFNIRCLFVLQPLLATKATSNPFERKLLLEQDPALIKYTREFYDGVRKQCEKKSNFIDLSGVLDGQHGPDFYDFGHTGPFSGQVIGKAIGRRIQLH